MKPCRRRVCSACWGCFSASLIFPGARNDPGTLVKTSCLPLSPHRQARLLSQCLSPQPRPLWGSFVARQPLLSLALALVERECLRLSSCRAATWARHFCPPRPANLSGVHGGHPEPATCSASCRVAITRFPADERRSSNRRGSSPLVNHRKIAMQRRDAAFLPDHEKPDVPQKEDCTACRPSTHWALRKSFNW